MSATNKYAQTQNETASRERLMVLLFETALRHMRTGANLMDDGRAGEARSLLVKASDIVSQLEATLDASRAPELCNTLGDLYKFVAFRLVKAISGGDTAAIREAERAFAPIADAFASAVASLPQEPTATATR